METKICTKCKRELPIENFRWKNKTEGRRHSQCKECQSKQEKEHYRNLSSDRQIKVQTRQRNLLIRNTEYLNSIKSNGCQKCGDKRLYVLDFHHIDPTQKDNTINHMRKSSSLENLISEVDKCIVLCANCHREFHFLENEKGISIEQYLD